MKGPRRGPPPLEPFGLILHHDGRWSHEGQPILHSRLREHFDHSVRFLPEEGREGEEGTEGKFVVTLRHFRGEVTVEECGFFVREFDAETGRLRLSDRSEELLDPTSLRLSSIDEALLCTVKKELRARGVAARFDHGAHAELLHAVEEDGDGFVLVLAGERVPIGFA